MFVCFFFLVAPLMNCRSANDWRSILKHYPEITESFVKTFYDMEV